MKNYRKTIIYLIILSLFIPVFIVSAEPVNAQKPEMRGLWVATVVNIDYPSKPTTDAEVLKNEALAILDNAQSIGFNTIFLQVRPSADALYKSQYFPWSKFLTGAQGVAPNDGFDPLEFWVAEAHKRGIELHAWLNPYRVTKKTSTEPNHDFNSLDISNPARLNPDWVIKHSDGNLYFDPGIPEVRKLIIDSILEITQNYAVDGIHFDDYFYPGKDFNDVATYAKYGTGYGNIEDWRRSNVDTLIRDISSSIKGTQKNIRFGISPFGIWANKDKNPLGSDTKGNQSYFDHYADSRKWVKEGMIDYIVPQIYWNIGFSVADYSKLLTWWKDTVTGTNVDLYIGQAAYRAGHSDPSSPWYGVTEIAKQMQLNYKTPEVKGSIFFNYKSLLDNQALSSVIKAIYERKDGVIVKIPVSVSRPSDNIATSLDKYYMNGASDPDKPLFLNGKPIESRSGQGYFGILVPLEIGKNIFTFSQEGSYETRVIYRNSVSKTPARMKTIEIPKASTFPQTQEYRTEGEKITLSCVAPIGSKVTVKLAGKSYEMQPSLTTAYGSGAYPTTYTYTYTVPVFKGTPRNIYLGTPVYTMVYMGKKMTRSAPAKVGIIMKNSPYYAKVTKDVIDTYKIPSSVDGAAFELYKGMTDYVTAMTGSYARLSSGIWVRKSSVSIYSSKTQLRPIISKATYKTGEKVDTLQLDISSLVAATASFDGYTLKLNIPAAASGKLPVLPKNSLLSAVSVARNGSQLQYILERKADQRIEGYHIEKTSTGIALKLKKYLKAKDTNMPLNGKTIMVDPGHGGSETGAIGPLGTKYSEKTINLQTALKLKTELEKKGAKVVMTRTSDNTLSLEKRLAASRTARPDMFVSIHANSMGDNVDISKVDGFSVFYREALSETIAQGVLTNTVEALNRNNMGKTMKNFYVTRGTWTPSILVESGFVPNPTEFEWLIDEEEQEKLAKTISEAIIKYFTP